MGATEHQPDGEVASLATAALGMLYWRAEATASSKTTFKPLSGLLELGEEDSTKRTANEQSRAELVGELRRFLRDYLRASDRRRVVIVIDELDKLSEAADLIAVVNDLKDLFHIEGTHFVVSVSSDALDRFASRGVPARDAFDSSFDAIIDVQRLTPQQSVDLVLSRAAGFPASLALFCHSWSGGLPRDLLRSARSCVECYRATDQPSTQQSIADSVIKNYVEQTVVSFVRSRSSADSSGLRAVVEVVDAVRGGDLGLAWTRLAGLRLDGFSDSDRWAICKFLEAAEAVHGVYAQQPVPLEGSTPSTAALKTAEELGWRVAAVSSMEAAIGHAIAWRSIHPQRSANPDLSVIGPAGGRRCNKGFGVLA